MRFYPVHCSRTIAEQKYIRAELGLWKTLPGRERERISALMDEIARGRQERSALETVLLKGVSPRVAAERYRLDKGRVYQMQKIFLERFEILC